MKNKQDVRTLLDLKISSSLSRMKPRLLMILYYLMMPSREKEAKLLTQMSSLFMLQARLSFQLWKNQEKLAELWLRHLR